jgi:hypothetical protein
MCEDFVNKNQCDETKLNSGSCKWMDEEEGECREVASSCSEIVESENACEKSKVVMNGDEVVECMWLEGVNGRCELKVYFFYLFLFFL